MVSEEYIQLPPDSTGKKLRSLKRTVGANEVYEEVFAIIEPSTGEAIDPRTLDLLLRILLNTPFARLAPDGQGRLRITLDSVALPAGSAVIGAVTKSGTWTVDAGGVFPVDQRYEMIQRANIEFTQCQRSKFTFV